MEVLPVVRGISDGAVPARELHVADLTFAGVPEDAAVLIAMALAGPVKSRRCSGHTGPR
jgi:hypothetical protein